MTSVTGSRIDADRSLLRFKSYEEYLDSLVTPADLCYLRSSVIARQLAELGYRSTGDTIDKRSFHKRLRAVKDHLFPIHHPYVLDSELVATRDPLERELAHRERSNRIGVLSTIIYIRQVTKLNYEISGYIDFADRLNTEDWQAFFRGKMIVRPRRSDIAYYNWRMSKTVLNSSPNYRPVIDGERGLLFANLHDGILVSVDPYSSSPGVDTTRVRVYSDKYEHVVLYDHVVRAR